MAATTEICWTDRGGSLIVQVMDQQAPAVPSRTDKRVSEVYDPLLVQTNGKGKWPAWEDGYKLYPKKDRHDDADRVMFIGNSTSIVPDYPWALRAADALIAEDRKVTLYIGAGRGHSSSQELLRVIRDAPGIKPGVIVAFSGICDFGNIMSSPKNPFYHKYQRAVTDKVIKEEMFVSYMVGFQNDEPDWKRWLTNHEMARASAKVVGAEYVAILQPVLGYGRYEPNENEHALLRDKAGVVLLGGTSRYIDSVTAFYDGVRAAIAADPARYAFVRDFSEVFTGSTEVWYDHRHPTRKGCDILGKAVAQILTETLPA